MACNAIRSTRPFLPANRNSAIRRAGPSRRVTTAIMAAKPTIYYFPIRGRAEVIRLGLSAVGVDFDELPVAEMKTNRELYPFAQCPVFVDDGLRIAQSNTIMRYIGGKYNLLGETPADKVAVDMINEGVESLRQKYSALIYVTKMSNKDEYFATHIDKANTAARNGGAHFAYVADLVAKHSGGKFAVGAALTIADLALYDVVDLHHRVFGHQFAEQYPGLMAHKDMVAAIPGIKAYLGSAKQPASVNNSPLG